MARVCAVLVSPPASGGTVDPVFGRSAQLLPVHASGLAVHRRLAADAGHPGLRAGAFFVLISGGTQLAERRFDRSPAAAVARLSAALGFLLLVVALRVYLGRFERLLADHTVFGGVTYTDAHVMLGACCGRLAAWSRGRPSRLVNLASGPRMRWLVAGAACLPWSVSSRYTSSGWYVASFIVKPNQLVREQPYIAHNIDFTRQAYGLDRIAQHEFPAETTVEAADPANNQATLQNIRLWDWHALQDTLRQIQEIRTYYDFPDIDIDRYTIDGTDAPGDAGRARAERRQAAREQPQLDQREADLHARLRHHHEPGERLHAGRACPR